MPEVRIDKQEAGRDLFNVAGDLIIQHPITHEPVYFPTIQSVLRKGETTDGDFFKKEPEWVDYEQGFIVERKEVDEIIKKLENNKIQLVLGAPASGKSTILKNVGFKLVNQNKVYVVELKKHPQDEIKLFFENIPKIDDGNPIFIIDDAHLNISECGRLIRDFKGRGKGKLIIGSRETKEITEGCPTETSEFEYLSKTCIRIHAEDVTEEMIKTFLKAKYQFDDERLKSISNNLEKYKEDLWRLSWALIAYNPEKNSVEEVEIYQKIRDSIRKIKAEDVFLPLSVFYKFEIPVERYFLEEQMDIEGNLINQLIGLQEIMELEELGKHKMLYLNHSSIAELNFEVYERYPDLGRRIKKNILNKKDTSYMEYCLFHRYITNNSENTIDIMLHLFEDFYRRQMKTTGMWLIRQLSEDNEIQNKIIEGIKKEEDIHKIGTCISMIAMENKEVGLILVKNIDINALSSKIKNEGDIEKIGYLVANIAGASIEIGLKLANRIDIEALSSKIEKEENLIKIAFCVSQIAQGSKEVAKEIVNHLKPKRREELLKKYPSLAID